VIKPDERALWEALRAGEQPRTAGPRLGIAPKRVRYLCEKWARRGIYDYGVSCDLGWEVGRVVVKTRWHLEQDPDGQWVYHSVRWIADL
jgi:hypothetical protein